MQGAAEEGRFCGSVPFSHRSAALCIFAASAVKMKLPTHFGYILERGYRGARVRLRTLDVTGSTVPKWATFAVRALRGATRRSAR